MTVEGGMALSSGSGAGVAGLHYVLIHADDCLTQLQLPLAQVVFIHHVIVAQALQLRHPIQKKKRKKRRGDEELIQVKTNDVSDKHTGVPLSLLVVETHSSSPCCCWLALLFCCWKPTAKRRTLSVRLNIW